MSNINGSNARSIAQAPGRPRQGLFGYSIRQDQGWRSTINTDEYPKPPAEPIRLRQLPQLKKQQRLSFEMVALHGLPSFLLIIWLLQAISAQMLQDLQPLSSSPTIAPLGCHRRLYTYRVTQSDFQGRECWDNVSVWSCWGRCDSSEISDWKFPYKRSFHPVCVHAQRQPSVAILKNCHPDATDSIRKYNYMEAVNCHCHTCSTEDTSCEAPTNNVLDEEKNVKILKLTGVNSESVDY